MKWNESGLTDKQSDRKVYIDYLRVFATFAVMILHISAQNWGSTDVNGFDWQVFNFFDSIVRWGVPVFVMISGSLFLNREISLRKLYSKYIRRMITAFIAWSAIYAAFIDGPLMSRVPALIQGHYHMWFILMIVGIYMCIPFIKAIAETDFRIKYFLALSFVFAFAFPEIIILTKDFGNEFMLMISNALNSDVNNMRMQMVLGYASYFVLGYYLDKTELNRRKRCMIYALGLAGFVFTIVMDLIVALKTQTSCGNYYGYFNVNILLEAVAVFTFFKNREYKKDKMNATIKKMSKLSFGAYCVHILIIEQLSIRLGLNTLSFNPAISVLSIGIVVFIVSFSISALLNRIPIINKYMV